MSRQQRYAHLGLSPWPLCSSLNFMPLAVLNTSRLPSPPGLTATTIVFASAVWHIALESGTIVSTLRKNVLRLIGDVLENPCCWE